MPCRTANHHGLEVNQCLVWKGWEPGKEYTKNIVLKNVNTKKTKKVEFTFPRNVSFKTLFPQQIVLSAGTSTSLPVTFRPIDSKVYEDKITLRTTEGELDVPVRAILPRPKLELPDHVDFGMCACANSNKKTFEIQNSGDLDLELEWVVLAPFSLTPESGVIAAKSKLLIEAAFFPNVGVVFESSAICKYRIRTTENDESEEKQKTSLQQKSSNDDGNKAEIILDKKESEEDSKKVDDNNNNDDWRTKSISFHGIGKFVHLVPSLDASPPALSGVASDGEILLEFGAGIAPGKRTERFVFLHNLSTVEAPFQIEQPGAKERIDVAFHSGVVKGVIPALSSVRLPIQFKPSTRDSIFVDTFRVSASSTSVITCVGRSIGSRVSLGVSAIVFNLVRLPDGNATMPLQVVNEGEIDAAFQFGIEPGQSAFKFDKTSGELESCERGQIQQQQQQQQ